MSKRILKLTEGDYRYIRGVLIPYIDSYEDIKELTLYMNIVTKDKIEYYLEAPVFDYLFGVKIKIDDIKNDVIILDYDGTDDYIKNDIKNTVRFMNSLYGMFSGGYTKNPTLPDKYIVNKDACILFYGNNKTIVKRSKGDKVDYVKAFLWAYFLHNSGMTRTKANKYLFNVWKTGTEVKHKK